MWNNLSSLQYLHLPSDCGWLEEAISQWWAEVGETPQRAAACFSSSDLGLILIFVSGVIYASQFARYGAMGNVKRRLRRLQRLLRLLDTLRK